MTVESDSQPGRRLEAPDERRKDKQKRAQRRVFAEYLAERTGLEPATPGVTGRYSNQLNYRSARWWRSRLPCKCHPTWRPLGDSNPCYNRERVVS